MLETARLQDRESNIVCQVPEDQRVAAQMFQPSVDRFGVTLQGVIPVEVSQYVPAPMLQRLTQRCQLDQLLR